jgi:hypothetical protein
MVAAGYIVEGVFFLLWGFGVALVSGRQLWLLYNVTKTTEAASVQNKSNRKAQQEAAMYKLPKAAQFFCFLTGVIAVIVNIDRRSLYGMYSYQFITLLGLLMLCPVFCFGMVWFQGVLSVMKDAGTSRACQIPPFIYYSLAIVNVIVTVGSWVVAVRRNAVWYLAFQVIFDLLVLVIAMLLTLGFLLFLERSFRNVSVNVMTPESKLKRQMLARRLWTAVAIFLIVLVLALIVVNNMVKDKNVQLSAIVPQDPAVYVWNSNSWTGASHLLISSIGIKLFSFRPPSDGHGTGAGDSRGSGNRPGAPSESRRKSSLAEEGSRKNPAVAVQQSDVVNKFQLQPQSAPPV